MHHPISTVSDGPWIGVPINDGSIDSYTIFASGGSMFQAVGVTTRSLALLP